MATLFTAVFALAGWWGGLSRLSDNSFFLHLRTGQWILDHGFPRTDLYSFTAVGERWVVQSWLAEVLYATLDRTLGPLGIRLLGAATGGLVAALAYRLALATGGDRLRAAAVTLPAVGASFTLWVERPLFLGVLAFVVLVWIVEVPGSAVGRRPMVVLPALFWLWVNVHGTFALGFAYLGAHLAGRWLEGAPPTRGRERRLALAAVVAGLACLVNPYGPALAVFPLDLLSRGEILREVVEWRSPDFRSIQGIAYAAWLATFLGVLGAGRRRPSRRDLVVALPFLLLGLWAQRNIAVVPFVGLPVAARLIGVSRLDAPAGQLSRPVLALLLAVGLLGSVSALTQPHYHLDRYPVAAMRAVERQELLGRRLLTSDVWAGWVILRYGPEQRVFFDDRYDLYPVGVTRDYLRFARGEPGWDGVLTRYDVELVVWDRDTAVAQLMERHDRWRRVYRDDQAAVFARR